jgi:hypothetical protein
MVLYVGGPLITMQKLMNLKPMYANHHYVTLIPGEVAHYLHISPPYKSRIFKHHNLRI